MRRIESLVQDRFDFGKLGVGRQINLGQRLEQGDQELVLSNDFLLADPAGKISHQAGNFVVEQLARHRDVEPVGIERIADLCEHRLIVGGHIAKLTRELRESCGRERVNHAPTGIRVDLLRCEKRSQRTIVALDLDDHVVHVDRD